MKYYSPSCPFNLSKNSSTVNCNFALLRAKEAAAAALSARAFEDDDDALGFPFRSLPLRGRGTPDVHIATVMRTYFDFRLFHLIFFERDQVRLEEVTCNFI